MSVDVEADQPAAGSGELGASGEDHPWPGRSLYIANLAGASATLVYAALVLYGSRGYAASVGNLPGPGLYPRAVGALLLLLAGIWLVQTLAGRYCQAADTEPAPTRSGLVRAMSSLGALVAFTFALRPIGYVLAALILVTVLVRLAGGRWRTALVTGTTFAAASFLLVTTALGIQLPLGVLAPVLGGLR